MNKKVMSLLLSLILVVTSVFVSNIVAYAEEPSGGLKVTATSNYFPEKSTIIDIGEEYVTVTYFINSSKDMLNTQWELKYDPNILQFDSATNMNEVGGDLNLMPSVNDLVCNVITNNATGAQTGRIKANATKLQLYKFAGKGYIPFVTATFRVIGSGETTVDLLVDFLTLSRLGSNFLSDPAEEEVIVDSGVINVTPTVPSRETAVHSGLYDPHCDITAPVISGIENSKTYCDTVEFEVSDNEGVASVTANGVTLTPDANNKYTLEKGKGTVTVVAIDKANNQTSVTVTVNDGHTAGNDDGDCSTPVYCIYHPDTVVIEAKSHDFSGDWNKNTDVHWHACQNEGCTVTDTPQPHSGGSATCTAKAECEYCGEEYGELDSSNHTGGTEIRGAKDATCTEEGYTGDTYCIGCGEKISAGIAIKMSAHNLEKIPAKDATVTETGNKEYWQCENCKKYFADEKGTNEISLEDTVIQKLPTEIIKGKGQSVAEGEKKALSFTSNAAFSDFIRVELDGKTLDEKNYIVKEGSTIVTLKSDYVATLSAGEHAIGIVSESDTATTTFIVNAKAVVDNDTKSPQTGDNSHMALWIALLLVSGAGVIGTTVYGKKKRAK